MGSQASPARERRRLEQRRLLDVARRYARRVADVVPVEFAVVGGSVARGDLHDASDIDVLVVSDALPQHPLQRSILLFSLVEGGVEPKGLTRTELTRELARRNPPLAGDGFTATYQTLSVPKLNEALKSEGLSEVGNAMWP